MNDNLENIMHELEEEGCYPCIYYRGNMIWRAHVNASGNYWAEAQNARIAMLSARQAWIDAGKPIDGRSDIDM